MRSTQANLNRKVHCIMGLPFDAITLEQATEQVHQAVLNRTPCFISTPNLNFLIAAQSNEAFRHSVIKSDLSLPDGMPIVWMAKLMGIPITQRVAGSDLFDALRKDTSRKIKVYFFGGPPGVAEKAMQVLNAEAGGLECVGFETPGFGGIEDMSGPETIARINASGAEFLVVSLGAVKGQAWIERNMDALNVPVISHLGAVLNFVAGNVRRAPYWMQRTGLEWLWRIVEEPMLWKRYSSDGWAVMKFSYQFLSLSRYNRSLAKEATNRNSSLVLQSTCGDSYLRIVAAGSCTSANLNSLKALFNKAIDKHLEISVDIRQATEVDSSFLGLMALVAGQQLNRNKSLKIENNCNQSKISILFNKIF